MENDKTKSLDLYELASKYEEEGKLQDAVYYYRQAFKLNSYVEQDYKDFYKVQQIRKMTMALDDTSINDNSDTTTTTNESNVIEKTKRIVENEYEYSFDYNLCEFYTLPKEVIEVILQYSLMSTNLKNLMSVSLTSRSFYEITRSIRFWKDLYENKKKIYPIWWNTVSADNLQHELIKYLPNHIQRLYRSTEFQYSQKDNDYKSKNFLDLFKLYPTVRHDGVYICRILYLRPGLNEGLYYNPVHVVNYYRYLYFTPKNEVISLLSNEEPSVIVPLFTKYVIAFNEHNFPSIDSKQIPKLLKNIMTGYYLVIKEKLFIITTVSSEHPHPLMNITFHLELEISSIKEIPNTALKNDKLNWKTFFQVDKMHDNILTSFDLADFKSFIFSKVISLSK